MYNKIYILLWCAFLWKILLNLQQKNWNIFVLAKLFRKSGSKDFNFVKTCFVQQLVNYQIYIFSNVMVYESIPNIQFPLNFPVRIKKHWWDIRFLLLNYPCSSLHSLGVKTLFCVWWKLFLIHTQKQHGTHTCMWNYCLGG